MPDIRISRLNPKADPKFFDLACQKMLQFNIPNLAIISTVAASRIAVNCLCCD